MEPQHIREALGDVFGAVFGRFEGFRPIQVATIPRVLSGSGVLVVAPTASGKTEAVLAPLLRRAQLNSSARPYALWLCPTRALVNDLHARIAGSFDRIGLHAGIRTGERKTRVTPNTAALVTTPESLDVMLSSRDLADQLRDIAMVVVDEAHLLFGQRRGLQVLMLLQRLEKLRGARILRAGLSATIAHPEAVATWLAGDGPALEVIGTQHQREVDIKLFAGYPDAMRRTVELVGKGLREREWRKILVFTNTRNEADHLAEQLAAEFVGFPVDLHFSSLPKDYRERVEKRFKEGDRGICVATSTLELGIDIGDIDAAYMYGAPGSISSFLQRAGRSNRRTERTNVIAIPRTHDQRRGARPDLWTRDVLTFAATDLAVRRGLLEQPHAPRYWSVLVQQAFSLARYFGRIGVEPLLDAAGANVAPFSTREGCSELLGFLEQLGYLSHVAYGDYYALSDTGWGWLESLQIWANFSDQSESVPIVQGGDVLDNVAYANRFLLKRGSLVRVKGQTREVIDIKIDAIEVGAPSKAGTPIPLKRLGHSWPVSFDIAQALASLTRHAGDVLEDVEPELRPWLIDWLARFEHLDLDSQIAHEPSAQSVYSTFLGGLGNRLLAELLSGQGSQVRPDDLGITGPEPAAFRSPALASAARQVENLAPALASQVPTSVHYAMLSRHLQDDEITSIVSEPGVIARIVRMPEMEVVAVKPPPAVPWI